VFDPDYTAPLNWRANLSVNNIRLGDWGLNVNGTWSLGVNGESSVDVNLNRTPQFTLPAEGARPVFVAPTAIVATTGVVAPGASRINPDFGRVTNMIADLGSRAFQFQASLNPPAPLFGKFQYSLNYTYSWQRQESRNAPVADPFLKEWAPGQQAAVNGERGRQSLNAFIPKDGIDVVGVQLRQESE